jgi:chitodextrinase
VFHDPQGDVAILIGKPGTAAPAPSVSPNTNAAPSSCSGGHACAYEGVNYTTQDYSYAFPSRFTPYTSLAGGCFSINSGFSFNDCAQGVYNNYGSCSYAQWWWNAGYGGNSFKNNVGSGDPVLGNIGQGDQFTSQINCN